LGGGIAALLVALVSPLDAAGGALFTAHMLQHLLLMAVAAPLLVLGAPQVGLAWGLPRRGRAAAARWWHALGLRALFRGLAHPLAAFALHAGALWAWHLPGAYDAALAHEGVHALEHASFLGTAALFWWVALHPAGRLRRSPGAAVLYAFAMAMASGALGALLAFSEAPWYAAHLQSAAAWGLTPAADQQLAGLVMWIPGGVPYLAAAVWLLLQWLRASERRVRAAEARRALAA
jgi:putative membrane protein